jgi:hypothetical protein
MLPGNERTVPAGSCAINTVATGGGGGGGGPGGGGGDGPGGPGGGKGTFDPHVMPFACFGKVADFTVLWQRESRWEGRGGGGGVNEKGRFLPIGMRMGETHAGRQAPATDVI